MTTSSEEGPLEHRCKRGAQFLQDLEETTVSSMVWIRKNDSESENGSVCRGPLEIIEPILPANAGSLQ